MLLAFHHNHEGQGLCIYADKLTMEIAEYS